MIKVFWFACRFDIFFIYNARKIMKQTRKELIQVLLKLYCVLRFVSFRFVSGAVLFLLKLTCEFRVKLLLPACTSVFWVWVWVLGLGLDWPPLHLPLPLPLLLPLPLPFPLSDFLGFPFLGLPPPAFVLAMFFN